MLRPKNISKKHYLKKNVIKVYKEISKMILFKIQYEAIKIISTNTQKKIFIVT